MANCGLPRPEPRRADLRFSETPGPRTGDIAAGLDFAYSALMSAGLPPAPRSRVRPGGLAVASIAVASLVAVAVSGCRFMPKGAHWVEAHGGARAVRVAGRPAGVVAIGTNRRLYAYPTDYARPWRELGPQEVRELASSLIALYVIGASGELWRVVDGQWTTYPGSGTWGATAIAASADDRLFVIVGGKTRRVDGADLRDAPCGDVVATAMAAVTADELYVIDSAGGLHHGLATSCALVTTPGPLRNVAVSGERLVGVTTTGAVWRRRGEADWLALPVVREYRSGAFPQEVLAAEVALSSTCTWVLDQAGAVFVLSDET